MDAMEISLVVFVCVFGSSIAGMILRLMLPGRHFSSEAQDVIKLALGLITTMTALILGFLISTAKASYDVKRAQLTQISADIILIDRSLDLYGSETKQARDALRDLVASLIGQIHASPIGTPPKEELRRATESNSPTAFYQMVRRLSPRNDAQSSLKAEALKISLEVSEIRALALAQEDNSIPIPFLVVLVFWLVILFAGLGLFSPPNFTVATALCICALAVSAAVFMIIEMDDAFVGVMRISSEPLRNAMIVITRQ